MYRVDQSRTSPLEVHVNSFHFLCIAKHLLGSEFLLTSPGAVAELGSTTLGEGPPGVAAWVSCCVGLSGIGVA